MFQSDNFLKLIFHVRLHGLIQESQTARFSTGTVQSLASNAGGPRPAGLGVEKWGACSLTKGKFFFPQQQNLLWGL